MDIQALHMQNNAYRDIINDLKRQIADYDRRIQVNEVLIGQHLTAMERDAHTEVEILPDCMFCMGKCVNDINLGE